ncbi:MAG: hypothetical protein M3R40_02330 [Pseudomonadota bacterium]|nr:hypothetical protein [Pseudomonadota bacterium]
MRGVPIDRPTVIAAGQQKKQTGGVRMKTTIAANALTNDVCPPGGFWRRPSGDDGALDAIRGIIVGTLVSVLAFWLPLAIALTR